MNTTYQDIELVLPPEGHCFHCGDPLPKQPFFTRVLGLDRPMCCMGCQLAAQSIVEAGLEQYYLDRSEINRTANLPDSLYQLQAYDHDEVKAQFVYEQDGSSVVELSIDKLRCAACGWLIETRLMGMDGVRQCQVNLTQQRMRVLWDDDRLPISRVLQEIQSIGYDAKPYRQDTHEAMLKRDNRRMLFQLGIAALGAMQAMMFAVALYFGEYTGIADNDRQFLRWVSLFVSIPVFMIAGLPFFQSAWSAIKAKQVNMDVPISIAIVITFFASLYATLTHTGETYYDSVSMLIFFLLTGKYLEHNARVKAANLASDLVVVQPLLVAKLGQEDLIDAKPRIHYDHEAEQYDEVLIDNESSTTDLTTNDLLQRYAERYQAIMASSQTPQDNDSPQNWVSAQSLQVGDIIRIDAGSHIISDGILLSPTATVSQSLITGESDLLVKHLGDSIKGGSQNDSQPFIMQVTALPRDSQMGVIDRLVNRSLSEKPYIAQRADNLARWFVARVLVIASIVFVAWYVIEPSQAIWATVAVLVATCPCALSLATPIALTVATNRLAMLGFLSTRGHTITTLAKVTHVAFDKTGTLTYGQPNLLAVQHLTADDLASESSLLAIAASLEVGSRHPIAHALLTAARQLHLPTPEQIRHIAGGGIQANIAGQCYRLGHFDFACENYGSDVSVGDDRRVLLPNLAEYAASTSVTLSRKVATSLDQADKNSNDNNKQAVQETAKAISQKLDESTSETAIMTHWQPVAHFYFHDKVREQAFATIDSLKSQGKQVLMLTGDPSPQAYEVAKILGIEHVYIGLTPDQKLAHLKALQAAKSTQAQPAVVQMVGDGINDAPVLAGANVSSAMAGAADLAQVASDSLILNGQIDTVARAHQIAARTDAIIAQNFRWALGYNIVVLLPAAFGYVPPWLAAIGMSLSSFFVVMNAVRLKRA